MAKRGPKPKKAKKVSAGNGAQAYEHTEEKLLLRPDIGLQPQFKQKKPPKTYRYDPALDPTLSWDISADRERGEALIASIEKAKNLTEAKAAAAELRQMSRPFLNWAGKTERPELTVPTLPLFVHERQQGRIIPIGNRIEYKRYLDDFPVYPLANVWTGMGERGFVGERYYVVQTDRNVIQRCILMTTDPGDLVLDPTCGSGTTAYVAEQWGRRWITIDTSRVPLALARQRLLTATFPYYELGDSARGPAGGFVYKRRQNQKGEEVGGIVPHITLKSIAQSQPPREEVLVDRPEVESGVVRVSGPFVVEATIPTAIEVEPTSRDAGDTYETDPIGRMIEVLRRSPTLRLAGNQTVTLKNIRRPANAMDLHAEAEMAEPTLEDLAEDAAIQKSLDMRRGKPVAFVFGPEHGPVTEQMVFAAAKEAHLKSYAHLFVIGFAAQPGATKLIQSCEQLVGLPATYVQATMDLLMADLLKTTRASQVFSVTGSPDARLIRLKRKNGNGPLYRVELVGLDVFDPVTMQNDHRKGDDVPAWFLDTDYDDLVFHVSQAFFPRTSAWENLKRALKGTYEDSVWEHLAGTLSEPFSAGDHRKVAVKVIDDRGNELMVVRSLDEAAPER